MTEEEDDVLLRFDEPGGNRSVVLEDDGRVAYAYLLADESLVGDVWLYNVAEPPDEVDWRDQSAMPFLNPARFCRQEVVGRLRTDSAVACDWSDAGVVVTVDGLPWARLEYGSRPGWSRNAKMAGPLAKPLEGV